MKSILSSASLLAVVAACNMAVAAPRVQDPGYYRTPEEARQRMPDPDADCLNTAGENGCVAVMLPVDVEFDGEPSLGWMPVWFEAGTETICIDSGTADFRVDCDAPDAVVSMPPPPKLCVRNRDGTRGDCPPGRELPYRPTPKP